MVRKTLYALVLISLVLVVNQVRTVNGTAATVISGSTPMATNVMTGSVEVRMSSSQADTNVTAAAITLSSLEIFLGNNWSKMALESSGKVNLLQVEGSEQTVATTDNLNPGTYTEIRLTVSRVDVTLQGQQSSTASLSYSKLTFIQNFTVTAKNTTVLVINLDTQRSIDDTAKNHITFKPVANLLFTTPGAMQITAVNPPQAEVGAAYNTQPLAIGGQRPYSWSITMGDLPEGLNLDPVTGVISGTPAKAGMFGFTIRVDDNSPTKKNITRNFTIGVASAGELQILTGNLPDGAQEGEYKATLLSTGGTPAYTWSIAVNNLPAGLTLNPGTGVISGIATASGDSTFVVKVTDSANPANTDTQILNMHIGKQILSK